MMTRRTALRISRRCARRSPRRAVRCSARRSGRAGLSVAEDRLRMIAALLEMEKYPGEYREAVRLLSGKEEGKKMP